MRPTTTIKTVRVAIALYMFSDEDLVDELLERSVLPMDIQRSLEEWRASPVPDAAALARWREACGA